MSPRFLSVEIVLAYHEEQLALFGGAAGVRDRGLLESALAQPAASFGGEYLHRDLHAMAAAYLFHIVRNHPFVDGNKRTGYIAALAFLELNGIPAPFTTAMYEVTVSVARGELAKEALARRLRELFPSASA
jgi:death-on-curing protein